MEALSVWKKTQQISTPLHRHRPFLNKIIEKVCLIINMEVKVHTDNVNYQNWVTWIGFGKV